MGNVTVYAKYRMSARLLKNTLFHAYGLEAATFMGGDSLSRLRDLVEKCQAVIFTPVAKEGLGLPEFDTLIHVSGHADEFTSRQIGGGLGSGYRLIGYGSLHYGLVKGGSESMIPVRLVIDLSWLLKSVAD